VDQDRDGTIQAESGALPAPDLCRFLSNPHPDCYCMNITGRKISKIVQLCADDYKSCSIYRSRTASHPDRNERGARRTDLPLNG
jgi:hypothetical protein